MVSGVSTIPLPGEALNLTPAPGRRLPGRVVLRSFFAGAENALARAAVQSLLEPRRPDGVESTEFAWSPLVLLGSPGVGKSHLARGIARHWQASGRGGQVMCVSGQQFAEDFSAAIESQTMSQFRLRYRGAALFVLDGLETLENKPGTAQELSFTLDALARSGAVVIVASRQSPCDISSLPTGLIGRLSAGLVVLVALPEAETRQAVLQELARLRGIALSERAAQALAQAMKATVPELLQLIVDLGQVDAVIDVSAADKFLAERAPVRKPKLAQICHATASRFSLKVAELRSASRNRTIVTARGIAMYLARTLLGLSLEEIGRNFGGRDHTTVLHNCRKIEKLLEHDRLTQQVVEQLQHDLAAIANRP